MKTNNRAFTLIEILIVVIVLGLLAAIIVPGAVTAADDAKASKMIATTDALRTAANTHYLHTNRLAIEYGGSNYTQNAHHQLSTTQTYNGWKGPYLDAPLTASDNPYGNAYVYTSFNSHVGNGFDLLGSGTDSATGAGQFILFTGVPESVAKTINDTIDSGITAGDWKTSGKVEYSGTNLGIFLMDVPN